MGLLSSGTGSFNHRNWNGVGLRFLPIFFDFGSRPWHRKCSRALSVVQHEAYRGPSLRRMTSRCAARYPCWAKMARDLLSRDELLVVVQWPFAIYFPPSIGAEPPTCRPTSAPPTLSAKPFTARS